MINLKFDYELIISDHQYKKAIEVFKLFSYDYANFIAI